MLSGIGTLHGFASRPVLHTKKNTSKGWPIKAKPIVQIIRSFLKRTRNLSFATSMVQVAGSETVLRPSSKQKTHTGYGCMGSMKDGLS
jgi:hypothetical protein